MRYDLTKIDASLEYGRFFTGGLLKFANFALGFTLFFLLLINVILLIFLSGSELDGDVMFGLISMNILLIPFFAVMLYIVRKNKKLKKNILIWIEDAVELIAYSENIGNIMHIPPQTKIRVTFYFDGKPYSKVSKGGDWLTYGHHKIFTRYANREINILYSPKYDQVLILKQ